MLVLVPQTLQRGATVSKIRMELEMIAVGFPVQLPRMTVLQYTAGLIKGQEAEGSGQPLEGSEGPQAVVVKPY